MAKRRRPVHTPPISPPVPGDILILRGQLKQLERRLDDWQRAFDNNIAGDDERIHLEIRTAETAIQELRDRLATMQLNPPARSALQRIAEKRWR